LIFNNILKAFDKKFWQRLIKAIILLIVIWGFALLTGLAPSVQRAGCMFTFIVFSKLLNRHSNVLNSIAGAAFLLLLLNPMMLFEVGFQLSFAAVIGIVTLHPIIYDWWEAPNWFVDKAWSLLVVSICAQLFTLPFVLYYFHQFPNWFLLTNLFVIPLAFAIVAGALLVSVVGLVFNNDFYLADILEGVLWVLNSIIHQLQKLPFFVTDGIWISFLSAVCLAAFVLLLTYYLHELKYFQLFTAFCCLLVAITIEYALNVKQSSTNYVGVYALKEESVYLLKNDLRAEVIYRDSISDFAEKVVEIHLSAINVDKVEIHNIKKSEVILNLGGNKFLFCNKGKCVAFAERIEADDCIFNDKRIRNVVASQLNSDRICTNYQEVIFDGNVAAWNRHLQNIEDSKQRQVAVTLNGFEDIIY
jgi:ComEC/Rec2-related protein